MRRGIIFSLIALLISSFILLLFWSANAPRLDTDAPAVQARVTVMDHYLDSWDAFVADATRLSVRRALTYLTSNKLTTNLTLPLSEEGVRRNLSSCLVAGTATIGGPAYGCFGGVNNSLSAQLDNFTELAREQLGIRTSYTLDPNITLEDWAPFELLVGFTINSTVTDPAFAAWNRTKRYDIVVSVQGLPDPLFAYYGDTWMLGPFTRRTLRQDPVPRDLVNATDVAAMLAARDYAEDLGMAPTYLQRFRGVTAESQEPFDPGNRSGIETLLVPADTLIAGSYRNASFTAHQVFAGIADLACGNASLGIAGFPYPTFHLDPAHLARYNFNSSQLNYTCS